MQNKTEDADVVATTVRFPRALRHRLEDAARSSFRPLSGEIAHRITLALRAPMARSPPPVNAPTTAVRTRGLSRNSKRAMELL
jgi:hypothetical protein